jgi:hypothetical protein
VSMNAFSVSVEGACSLQSSRISRSTFSALDELAGVRQCPSVECDGHAASLRVHPVFAGISSLTPVCSEVICLVGHTIAQVAA